MNEARTKLTWSLIVIVGFLTLCPVLMLLLGSFSQGLTAFGTFTLSKYVAAYTDPFLLEVSLHARVRAWLIAAIDGPGAGIGLSEHTHRHPVQAGIHRALDRADDDSALVVFGDRKSVVVGKSV